MEGIEMEESPSNINETNADLCNFILSRYRKSTSESHQYLCAIIGAMSQELKDHNLPLSPVAYFGATCSSLDRIASEPNPANHLIDALLTIPSLVIVRLHPAVLEKKREFLSELVVKVPLSPSSSETAVIHGLKCLSHLLINRHSVHWADVSPLFNVLLWFITDSRFKIREQSCLFLCDVLISFQKSSLLAFASEGVQNILDNFLLLVGEVNGNANDANTNAGKETIRAQQHPQALQKSLGFVSTPSHKAYNKLFKFPHSKSEIRSFS
ncbi:hypothetical protein RYX36_019490 [Vicia faba]